MTLQDQDQTVPPLVLPSQVPGESSSVYAGRVIRNAILTGVLAPGAVIPQGSLAEQMGISRIPVRDALRQLETEGLVQIPSNKAARVATVDLAELIELYDLREMIEPYAVARSSAVLSRTVVDRLQTLADMFDSQIDSEQEVLRIDREFHTLSMSGATSPRIQRLVSELLNASQHFRRAYWAAEVDHRDPAVSKDHHDLVAALRDRDGVRASDIARTHLQRTRHVLQPSLD